MDPERSRRQIVAVAEVVELAANLDIEVWLRGGWAMDFFLGEITRDHLDVDWFTWADDMPTLVDELIRRGWSDVGVNSPQQQRDIRRGEVEMGFAPLAATVGGRPVVGGGAWAGEPWPERMLSGAVEGRLGKVRCLVIDPAAQVEIKQMMPVWVSERPRRAKDAADIEQLVAAMRTGRLTDP